MMGFMYVLVYLLNFFFLDRDPRKCARYHADKHINKMQVEYAQIASSVMWIVAERNGLLDSSLFKSVSEMIYKPTHTHHPIVIWASKSQAHVLAVVDLGLALAEEKAERAIVAKAYGKKWSVTHKSTPILRFIRDHLPSNNLFELGSEWHDPPACVPQCIKDNSSDIIDRYRLFYAGHKVEVTGLKWAPYVQPPDFLVDCQARIACMPDVLQDIENEKNGIKTKKMKTK
jgi:hypothetical protein